MECLSLSGIVGGGRWFSFSSWAQFPDVKIEKEGDCEWAVVDSQ